ncbi:hypothetical protein RYJ27_05120 [Microbacterium limosum]|uniref:Membrane protein YczE n=1 Tax=Microbacterium limosum TaxID=3079935 RepID=A0AAU0MKH0_9MICO|nr:hypothetical protein [Microbacterium sp. Y20]WOQ70586.1 hypothetical protein RYJ27_05120 [Microbacterium sp. Y20]
MLRRSLQLPIGLVLYGVGCAVMIAAGIGLDPWTVFAQGVSKATGMGIGWVTSLIGLGVLLLWIPLRQRPGLGTVLNILMVGTAMQLALDVIPTAPSFALGCVMFAAGIAIVGLGSGLYIGARFGPGPRDGLMTGLSHRLGWPLWVSRTLVEAVVLTAGWLLGGTVGIGTVAFAVLIGPLAHAAVRAFDTAPGGAGTAAPHASPAVTPAAGAASAP